MSRFTNGYTTMWIEDGILYTTYNPGLKITLAIAQKCVADRLELSGGNVYPMLGDTSNIASTDKDAREFLSQGDGIKQLSAGAFIIKSVIEKHLGNFFIQVNKPPLPARLFTRYSEAVEWLQQFKTKTA